jgi:hypothetical protein
MTNDTFVGPSETLEALRRVGRETWMDAENSAESALSVAAAITAAVTEALPDAAWPQVGWAIFAVGAQVALKDEAFAGHVRRAIPPAQVLIGVRRGAQLTCRVGDALIDRGEQRSDGGAFQINELTLDTRPKLVGAAEAVVVQLLQNDELATSFRAVIRGGGGDASGSGGDGMVAGIARALPGIDGTQAGWGLIVCGSRLLSLADDAAPTSKPRRWRPRPQADGADLLGTALVGSVAVIAGDAWLGLTGPEQQSSS